MKVTTHMLPLPCKSCIVMISLFTLVLCVYYDGFCEVKVVMKFLRETKRYRAKHSLSEFPTKVWNCIKFCCLLWKLYKNNSGSASYGPPCSFTFTLTLMCTSQQPTVKLFENDKYDKSHSNFRIIKLKCFQGPAKLNSRPNSIFNDVGGHWK